MKKHGNALAFPMAFNRKKDIEKAKPPCYEMRQSIEVWFGNQDYNLFG